MKRDKKLVKSLLGYLGAAFSVLVLASIPSASHAISASASACFSFGFSTGGVSIGGGSGGCGLGSGGIGDSLCQIVGWFEYGGIGAAVASMAVIFMGIAAFFGKVTWGMALVTAASIFAIFGAEEIVSAIIPSSLGALTSCSGGGFGLNVGF